MEREDILWTVPVPGGSNWEPIFELGSAVECPPASTGATARGYTVEHHCCYPFLVSIPLDPNQGNPEPDNKYSKAFAL